MRSSLVRSAWAAGTTLLDGGMRWCLSNIAAGLMAALLVPFPVLKPVAHGSVSDLPVFDVHEVERPAGVGLVKNVRVEDPLKYDVLAIGWHSDLHIIGVSQVAHGHHWKIQIGNRNVVKIDRIIAQPAQLSSPDFNGLDESRGFPIVRHTESNSYGNDLFAVAYHAPSVGVHTAVNERALNGGDVSGGDFGDRPQLSGRPPKGDGGESQHNSEPGYQLLLVVILLITIWRYLF
jgi:hypothetical protein